MPRRWWPWWLGSLHRVEAADPPPPRMDPAVPGPDLLRWSLSVVEVPWGRCPAAAWTPCLGSGGSTEQACGLRWSGGGVETCVHNGGAAWRWCGGGVEVLACAMTARHGGGTEAHACTEAAQSPLRDGTKARACTAVARRPLVDGAQPVHGRHGGADMRVQRGRGRACDGHVGM